MRACVYVTVCVCASVWGVCARLCILLCSTDFASKRICYQVIKNVSVHEICVFLLACYLNQ